MIKLDTWIKPVKDYKEPVQFVVSDRFIDKETGKPAEWTLAQIGPDRSEKIQEQCMIDIRDPETKQIARQLDNIKYVNALTVETIVEPNLRDPDIQEAYGTTGSAVSTLNAMLSIPEKNRLLQKTVEIYNLDQDILGEEIEDVKNE